MHVQWCTQSIQVKSSSLEDVSTSYLFAKLMESHVILINNINKNNKIIFRVFSVLQLSLSLSVNLSQINLSFLSLGTTVLLASKHIVWQTEQKHLECWYLLNCLGYCIWNYLLGCFSPVALAICLSVTRQCILNTMSDHYKPL